MDELGLQTGRNLEKSVRICLCRAPGNIYLPNICFFLSCELPVKFWTATPTILIIFSWRWYWRWRFDPFWWVTQFSWVSPMYVCMYWNLFDFLLCMYLIVFVCICMYLFVFVLFVFVFDCICLYLYCLYLIVFVCICMYLFDFSPMYVCMYWNLFDFLLLMSHINLILQHARKTWKGRGK